MPDDLIGDYDGYTPHENDIVIDGCRLFCTSIACPEQYDVFVDATQEKIGYLRLRGGWFRADYPDHGGETVYEANPKGDGIFDDDERQHYLTEAINALKQAHANQTNT